MTEVGHQREPRLGSRGHASGRTAPGQVGRKAATLAVLAARVRVPDFEVLPAAIFRRLPLPPETVEAIARRVARLGPGPFAVRSSACEEDGGEFSFAGVLLTRLGVLSNEVAPAAAEVAASADGADARAYRARAGAGSGDSPAGCAVIVQRLVEPRASGVAFSAEPVTGDAAAVIVEAVAGGAAPLLSGQAFGQRFRIGSRSGGDGAGGSDAPWRGCSEPGSSRPSRNCMTIT